MHPPEPSESTYTGALHCPPHWLDDLDGFSDVSSTSAVWDLTSSPGGSIASSLAGWVFVNPVVSTASAAPGSSAALAAPFVSTASAAPAADGIAQLDDVASTVSYWEDVASTVTLPASSAVASSAASTAASSSDNTSRIRRWGKHRKHEDGS